MKPKAPGSTHEALSEFFEAIGVKRAAAFENVHISTIYKEIDPDQPGEHSFARIARLTDHFKCLVAAQFLARKAGAIVIPLPKAAIAPSTIDALVRVAESGAHAVATGWAAHSDGVFTPAEKTDLRHKIDASVEALESFRLLLDEGDA